MGSRYLSNTRKTREREKGQILRIAKESELRKGVSEWETVKEQRKEESRNEQSERKR